MISRILTQYVRSHSKGRKGRRIGVLVATLTEEGVAIGHSKWNKEDPYDINLGRFIAMRRMQTSSKVPPALSIFRHYERFAKRVIKYFKTPLSYNTRFALQTAEISYRRGKIGTSTAQSG